MPPVEQVNRPPSRGVTMVALISVPTNPIEGLLRQLSLLVCTISAGQHCVVIQ
ncbi:hypothetical protein ACIA8C_02270 [Nocardia sp. NPDC051321]|uniref:hypothetical protein n=1 Tax=Nocardia sp. NPDC051321 TaxID=3364323 RepID=UPI0037B3747D